ncbi:MAG TPA: DegT/DnrJ/EryC1/StrS family aminotransferase, partial [Pirellulales bacterium]|nr:DegT/DnrJ/EryC1/StrS family aminotransferase [Pirellulales bacterium]
MKPCKVPPAAARHPVAFLDLRAQHAELVEELKEVFAVALAEASFVGGPMVEAFEHEFAAFTGSSHALGVGSGTDALRLALLALGIGPGMSVVTVPNSFVATTAAITQAGAEIEFVDVDPRTCLLDPDRLADHLRRRFASASRAPRPAAIVPVHLYGQCADMTAIAELAERYELQVVEDAAQAHGASHRGRQAGSLGHAAAFSFYPGKNLGACGEAGAITTADPAVAESVRRLRDHGRSSKYEHAIEGYNARLDAIQAGFLRVKLRHLGRWNALRRTHAARYDAALAWVEPVASLVTEAHNVAVHHLYVIRTQRRDALRAYLDQRGIGTGVHYPVPLHLQACYRRLGLGVGAFPETERAAAEVVSLPIFPHMTAADVDVVVA